MSEEKMRSSFQEWADKRGVWPMLTHEEIFAAGWQASLQEKMLTFDQIENCFGDDWRADEEGRCELTAQQLHEFAHRIAALQESVTAKDLLIASLKEDRDAWRNAHAEACRSLTDFANQIEDLTQQLAAANGRAESVKKIIRFWIANFHNGYPEKHNLEFVLADIEETSEESDLPEADKEKS